jgi:hypothetical protein
MEPEMEPIAQHSVLRFFHDHSFPFTWGQQVSIQQLFRDLQNNQKKPVKICYPIHHSCAGACMADTQYYFERLDN